MGIRGQGFDEVDWWWGGGRIADIKASRLIGLDGVGNLDADISVVGDLEAARNDWDVCGVEMGLSPLPRCTRFHWVRNKRVISQ